MIISLIILRPDFSFIQFRPPPPLDKKKSKQNKTMATHILKFKNESVQIDYSSNFQFRMIYCIINSTLRLHYTHH